MNNDPYAPPKAVVDDVTPGPTMPRPWQVRLAVGIGFLSLLMEMPEVLNELWFRTPADVREESYFAFMVGAIAALIALFCVLFFLLARGYRWARIVYSVLTLIGLLGVFTSIPDSFHQAVYLGVLDIAAYTLDAATLWLLFTGPANGWFRTQGGRIEAS